MTDAVIGFVTFANQPQTTVSNGGTDAPASGTSEQWTVSSSASFPIAQVLAPVQSFAVADTASTSEIIQVTAVTSNVWGVIRGAESTTPVTHASNFTVQQVVTAGALQNFTQYPNTGFTVAATAPASSTTTIATYIPGSTDVPAAGAAYAFSGYGVMWNTSAATLITISTNWGGVGLATAISGTNGTIPSTMTAASFWMEGQVNCYGATTMVSGFNFEVNKLGTLGSLIGVNSTAVTSVTISSSTGPLNIVMTTGAAMSLHTTGFYIHRIG